MLPELIYREERHRDYRFLVPLGAFSVFLGFAAAKLLFPSQNDLLTVVFASIPLVYALTRLFLEDEKDDKPHMPEIKSYGAIFAGEVLAFVLLGFFFPDVFQIQSDVIGATGFATASASFTGILVNNMIVFLSILAVAAIIGSSGAFILTWNASVLGIFFGKLFNAMNSGADMLSCSSPPSPICFLPHATFEMSGFIVAGVAGSLISGALYREHFDRKTWRDYGKLVAFGALLVLIGAFLETA